MSEITFPAPTAKLAHKRRNLAPAAEYAFHAFSKAVFEEALEAGRSEQPPARPAQLFGRDS